MLGIDRTWRYLALQQGLGLDHGLQGLVLSGGGGQATDVRCGNHFRVSGQGQAGGLVGATPHVHCRTREVAMVQSVHQCILVDQVAPGGIDEPCTGLHLRKGVGIEQIFCFFYATFSRK